MEVETIPPVEGGLFWWKLNTGSGVSGALPEVCSVALVTPILLEDSLEAASSKRSGSTFGESNTGSGNTSLAQEADSLGQNQQQSPAASATATIPAQSSLSAQESYGQNPLFLSIPSQHLVLMDPVVL